VKLFYQQTEKSGEHLKNILSLAKKTKKVILATDPDREGEAIAFHIVEYLKESIDISNLNIERVCFYEITKEKVKEALSQSRLLDMALVNAQQARRALDYLVGFYLSPVLWRKVKPKLSAGRVQTSALRMIVDRHKAIEDFKPREDWTLHPKVEHGKEVIEGVLTHFSGKKLKQFSIVNEAEAKKSVATIVGQSENQCSVVSVKTKKRNRKPSPPFITSTLQQEAARKLGFSAINTMRIAQQLFEGIELKGVTEGLITYMRTDSVVLSQDAILQIRKVISSTYGKNYLPKAAYVYSSKTKNAQEAHEAIRPVNFSLDPEKIKAFLSAEQYKLYKLIWLRSLASQMTQASFEDQVIVFDAKKDHLFEARRSQPVFLGFLSIYQEGEDVDSSYRKKVKNEKFLTLKEGDQLKMTDIEPRQHFTQPPGRFSEASLIKELESLGIGRPSTYASIISTLKTRQYVKLEKKRFYPTDIGILVSTFLSKYFTQYVDYDFTANLEDILDDISHGKKDWEKVILDFWEPFHLLVDHVTENVSKKEVTQEEIDENCPKCENPLLKKFGKMGNFIGCSGYPECKYTRSLDGESSDDLPEISRKCPQCSKALAYKRGRYGIFIGCTGYPDCRHIESTKEKEENEKTDVLCPECKKHYFVKKRSRRGTFFYSCEGYPDCKTAISSKPVGKPCPQCQHPFLLLKETKKLGLHYACVQKECDFKEACPEQGS
jgi:DNA topoisomerase-1